MKKSENWINENFKDKSFKVKFPDKLSCKKKYLVTLFFFDTPSWHLSLIKNKKKKQNSTGS